MLYGDVVKKIKEKSHRGDKTITTDDITATIISCVTDALRDVVKQVPKRSLWTQTTLAVLDGTATYALAADLGELDVIRYTVGTDIRLLKKIMSDKEWYEQVYNLNTPDDDPRYYREIGPDASGYIQIELFPVPSTNRTATYDYYKDHSKNELTTSDLSTEIPYFGKNTDVLWKGGLYYFLKCFDDGSQAMAKMDYEESKLAFEKKDDADEDADIRFRWGVEHREPIASNGMRIF